MTIPTLRSAAVFLLASALSAGSSAQEISVEELPAPPAEAQSGEPGSAPPPVEAPAADPAPPADPAAAEQEAIRLYSEGDLGAALALYARLGALAPEPAEKARLLLTAAWLAWQLEDPAGALAHLEAALFAAPAVEFRAELYPPEFGALYQDALRNAVHRRRVVASESINRSVAEIRAGRYAEARALLAKALDLTPNDPDGLYNLAVLDLREKREDAALAGFERVLALERGDPQGVTAQIKVQALNNSAVIYFSRGAFEEAEAALAEAVELEPGDGGAWFNLALARQRLGRDGEAYEALRRAYTLAPGDVSVARALALAELDRSSWTTAVALLLDATERQPADADLFLHLGRAQRGLGNAEGAVASFRRAVELDPADAGRVGGTAALLLAETLRSSGDVEGWRAAGERATELRPRDGGAWMLLGLARLSGGDAAGARDALERARELAPARADVAHNLGTAYLALRDPAGAEEAFAAAAAIDPANPDTAAALAALRAVPPPASGRAAREVGAELVPAAEGGARGLRVGAVETGSPAHRAGLRPGDLLLRSGERALAEPDDLRKALREGKGTALVTLLRAGRSLELSIRLPS